MVGWEWAAWAVWAAWAELNSPDKNVNAAQGAAFLILFVQFLIATFVRCKSRTFSGYFLQVRPMVD